jgi:hypothetical protein
MEESAEMRRKKTDNPVARLAMVLLRYSRGWWEQAAFAKATGFKGTQISKWDRGDRPVPDHALERSADVTGFPRHLLGVLLRGLRSFLLAMEGKSRPRRALAEVSVLELFPLAASVLDLILEPLDAEEPPADDPEAAELLLERLKRRTEAQRRFLVERVEEFRHPALVELAAEESRRLAASHPEESLGWAKLASRIAEMASIEAGR